MESLKTCSLCGCSSNETAIFSCAYAKGALEICLECLTEGIMEVHKTLKETKDATKKIDDIQLKEMGFETFDFAMPDPVFGFNCEGCGSIMFSDTFPVQCEACKYVNSQVVLRNQDITSSKK